MEEGDGFGRADWLKAVGGFAFFVFGLLTWWQLDAPNSVTFTTNAFDFQLTGLVPYIIFVAIGILTLLGKTQSLRLAERLLHPLLFLVAAAAGTVLVGYRFFIDGWDLADVEASRGIGLYGAMLSALVVLAGCIIEYRDALAADDEEDDEDDEDDEEDDDTPPTTHQDATPRGPEQPPLP